jgi:alpha-glucosidase
VPDNRPWWQRGVVYQIYPRSFADSDGDGVGDLRGIVTHLPYLRDFAADALQIDAIWLSPFYPSPMADFGYDVADYKDVDPVFGTLDDFDALLAQAHRRGIRIVIDWVPNHTSERHPWFLDSRSGRHSAKRDWYVWRDPAPGGGPPNNWWSSFEAVGPAWTFDSATGQYYLHSFTPQQPDLNWDNDEVREAMHDTLRFWLDRGVDGFRLDAIFKLAKDPKHGDNEPGRRHDQDWPTIHDRLRGIRAVVDEYRDRMIVGEVYLYDLRRVLAYIDTGDQLHLAHNFVFVNLPWDAGAMRRSVDEFERLSASTVWPAWFLENHDHSRVATRYADGPASARRRARVAAMLVCTLRGTPFLFQGEELGLPDAEVLPGRIVDVAGRDPERAPIPWRPISAAGPGAGFTTGTPWLPLVADAEHLNVASQLLDPSSTLTFVRSMIALRAREPALHAGSQRTVAGPPSLLCFLREHDARVLVALNFSSLPVALALGDAFAGRATIELSTDDARAVGEVELGSVVLAGDEGLIARLV